MENKKINYIVFDVNGKNRRSYIGNLVATSANQKVFIFNDADITTESTAYRSYARIKRADSFNVGPITLLASEITVENTGYTQDELNKFLESINVDYTSCRILILEKQALAVSGPISITVVYDRVNELGRTIETQAKAEVSAYVYNAVEEIFTEEEYTSIKEEMLPRDLGDVAAGGIVASGDRVLGRQNGISKMIDVDLFRQFVHKYNVIDLGAIDSEDIFDTINKRGVYRYEFDDGPFGYAGLLINAVEDGDERTQMKLERDYVMYRTKPEGTNEFNEWKIFNFDEIHELIEEGIIGGTLESFIEDRVLAKVDEINPRLSTVESKVSNLEVGKRDKSVKITKNDMDISTNANKLGLENLQDEVIQAISGNAPVNNVIGDNAVVSEKIAEEAINIKHLNNDLKSLFFLNNKYGSDYSFVIGGLTANGLEAPTNTRIRSEYITSTNAIIIELIDKVQFNMNVWLYSKEGVYIDRTELTTEPFVLTNEYMARIVLSYKDNRYINEEDIPTLTSNIILKEQEVKLKDNSIGNSKIIDKSITPEKTDFIDVSKNLINIDNAIIGYRLSSVNGELIEDSLYITTEFIEVEPNATYYRSLTFPIFWYDKDKNFISRNATGSNTATSPINAKYMRYANSAVNFYATMLAKGAEADYEPYYVKLNEKLLPKKEDDYFTKSPNLYNRFDLLEGLGETRNSASFPVGSLVSDYIEVKENVVYSKTPDAIHIIFYDKNKNAILGEAYGIDSNTILMPFGTSFVRIRVLNSNPNFMFNEGEELLPYEDYGYVLKSTNKRPIKIDESLIGDIEFDKETIKEEIINEINSQNALRPYPPVLEYTISDANFRYVDWMSDDGTILFGANGPNLRQSLTDGESWNLIKGDFEGNVSMVRQLKDGQLLVGVAGSGTTIRGHVLKSVNYDPQNPTATIFNKVLDLNIGSIYITGSWGISIYNNIIVMNEYGSKALPNNARYTYLSTDMGETWEVIFDLGAIEGAHLHGCCFDPYYSRIYISNGDGTNHRIRYSDDFGATWTIISDKYQPVSMLAFPSGVIMATDDRANGILRIPRTKKEDVPQIIEAYHAEPTDKLRLCGQLIYQKPVPGSPAFISFTTVGDGGRGIVLATVDGIHFYEIFRDFQTYDSLKGMRALVGPTASGKLIGTLSDNRQASYSRIVANAPEWVK